MHNDVLTYFEELATYHPALAHTPAEPCFFRSISEAANAISGSHKFPMLIYVEYRINLNSNPDSLRANWAHELMLVSQATGAKDFDSIHGIFNTTLDAANKLVGRIQADREAMDKPVVNLFDLSDVQIVQIAMPVLNNCYGHDILLPALRSHKLQYNPAEWLDYVP